MSGADAHESAATPRARGGSALRPGGLVIALTVAAGLGLRTAGVRILRGPGDARNEAIVAVTVDRGDVPVVVVEGGALESANNATVKCRVEALIGQVGGPKPSAGGAAAASGGSTVTTGTSKAATPAGSTAGTRTSSAPSPSTTPTASTSTSSTKPSTSGGGASGGPAPLKAPVITSFTYVVKPHSPLRRLTAAAAQARAAPAAAPAATGGGGGGGNRGGGRNAPQTPEKAGSTRILTILPEGSPVKQDDVVCELDSSAFRDEVAAQLIRHAQSKAWVEQAAALLEVNDIALREYREGLFREDQGLIDSYIEACQLQRERAVATLEWSRAIAQQKLRTPAQLRGDVLTLQRAEIALREAFGMKLRLEKYTAPKIIKSLEAKGEAIRADKLAQASAFGLEDARLRRLQKMVENCTMRAPRDGIVVYANQTNAWGRVDTQIVEGLTVREGMPIFNLPDPKHMRVRAKINESKVVAVHAGQDVAIRVDAFPDRPFRGKVAEVTPMPAPSNGLITDIKIYFAMIDIDGGGSADLRPGLSAEVSIAVGAGRGVTRVPVSAVRWVGATPFAAKLTPRGPEWSALELGLSNATFAEVRSGLEPGDRVAADPESATLPAPPRPRATPARPPAVAGGWSSARPKS